MASRLLLSSRMEHAATHVDRPDHTLQRVVGEYLEMPGLSLTVPQARRLWGLDAKKCEELLEHLVGQHFLRRTPRGLYVRLTAA
jgi:hypothetical protein